MKILVLCNSDSLAFPTISKLKELGFLTAIGIVKKNETFLAPMLEDMDLGVDIVTLERKSWEKVLADKILETKTDTVWVLTFPWKVPASLLKIPPYGFVNFHFGILPKYKGIDPIFWQFKNRERDGGFTIHLMNENIDEGPVLHQELVSIFPGENYGFHCMRLGNAVPDLVEKVVQIQNDENFEYVKLEPSDEVINQKPSNDDLTIDWQRQTSEEIEALINATNPKYQGARTRNNDVDMSILEITPVNLDNPVEAEPGQIVHADSVYGLVVACSDDEYVRITVARTREGYVSGVKLFNLGFVVGHRFD